MNKENFNNWTISVVITMVLLGGIVSFLKVLIDTFLSPAWWDLAIVVGIMGYVSGFVHSVLDRTSTKKED